MAAKQLLKVNSSRLLLGKRRLKWLRIINLELDKEVNSHWMNEQFHLRKKNKSILKLFLWKNLHSTIESATCKVRDFQQAIQLNFHLLYLSNSLMITHLFLIRLIKTNTIISWIFIRNLLPKTNKSIIKMIASVI